MNYDKLRQKDRKTERKKDRKTERQKDRKAERLYASPMSESDLGSWTPHNITKDGRVIPQPIYP